MSVSERGVGFEVYVRAGSEGPLANRRWRLQAKTEKQATAMEAEIRSAVAAGREPDMATVRAISETGKKTLRQVADIVYATRWKGHKSEGTTMLNLGLVLDILGEQTPVGEITQESIDRVIEGLRARGNSDATINRKLSPLRILLEAARKRKWLVEAPELPHWKEGKGRVRFFTDGEEQALLSTTHNLGALREAELWEFLLGTGARVGEALKLQWQDVTRTQVSFVDTKNGETRTIPLTARLRGILWSRKPVDRPFPLTYPEVRHTWDRVRTLLSKDGDPQWVVHTLRHTFASRLVQRGVPLIVVMQCLGHKSIQMTMRYAHLAPSNLNQIVLALDRSAPVAEQVDAAALEAVG